MSASIHMVQHHPNKVLPSSVDDESVHIANTSAPIHFLDYNLTLIVEHTQSMLRLDIPTNLICTDYTPPAAAPGLASPAMYHRPTIR